MLQKKASGVRTALLYWEDPYVKSFKARVVRVEGNRVALDRSCFYPRGGGQVGDTGFIENMKVVDTSKDDEGTVWHVLEKECPFSESQEVSGVLDWDRRYRTMRLHSAAHIVYYMMERVYGLECKPASSGIVDPLKDRSDYLFSQSIDKAKLKELEELSNRFVAENKPITTWTDEKGRRHWLTEGLPEMFCGGTHVKNTSEIGRVAVRRGSKPGAGKERIEITLAE